MPIATSQGLPATVERDLLVATRRDLHRHPELAFQEHRTAGLVADRLRAAGYEVRTGVGGTGVVGTLPGSGPGPALLLRADMDALPITEATEHGFGSGVAGTMHACGHDAHVAIGLAVAERLARARSQGGSQQAGRWPGVVHYLFQPAEEIGQGARRMIAEGVLEGVSAALGLHLWLPLESGTIGVVPGPMMASSAEWEITIRGRGGHGAMPHETRDAVWIGSQLVLALQGIVSRNLPPLEAAVVSIGAFQAGSASNVIADTATLKGTVRAFNPAVEREIPRRMEAIASGVCAAWDAEHTFRYEPNTPAVVNHPRLADRVREAAMAVVGPERVRTDATVPTMAAEDFGEFAARVPSCFFFVGGRNEQIGAVHPHHSPRFDLCEDALSVGVEVLERAALAVLRNGVPAG